MTPHTHHAEPFPKGMLVLAGVLVGGALVMTATLRLTGTPPQSSPTLERAAAHVAAVNSRDLSFTDQADGSVRIIDAATGATAGSVDAGSKSGFIRGVMRGLMRNRHQRGVGIAPPFRLTLWANGQISITDTTSGYVTDLSGFGETNRGAFMALLK
jgi:putative photosynthetic complex assembly protein